MKSTTHPRGASQPSGWLAYFVRHRTAANLLLVVMLIGGVYAGSNIRAQFFPDVVLEVITVSVAWSGAGADGRPPRRRGLPGLRRLFCVFCNANHPSRGTSRRCWFRALHGQGSLVFEPPGFFRPMLTINCQTSGQPDGAEKILQRVGHPQGAPPAWAARPPPARKT